MQLEYRLRQEKCVAVSVGFVQDLVSFMVLLKVYRLLETHYYTVNKPHFNLSANVCCHL